MILLLQHCRQSKPSPVVENGTADATPFVRLYRTAFTSEEKNILFLHQTSTDFPVETIRLKPASSRIATAGRAVRNVAAIQHRYLPGPQAGAPAPQHSCTRAFDTLAHESPGRASPLPAEHEPAGFRLSDPGSKKRAASHLTATLARRDIGRTSPAQGLRSLISTHTSTSSQLSLCSTMSHTVHSTTEKNIKSSR